MAGADDSGPLLIAERMRRRMRVRFADEWIARSEDIEAGAVAIDSRKSVKTVAGDVAPHPMLSEAIKGAALVARGRAIDLPNRAWRRRSVCAIDLLTAVTEMAYLQGTEF